MQYIFGDGGVIRNCVTYFAAEGASFLQSLVLGNVQSRLLRVDLVSLCSYTDGVVVFAEGPVVAQTIVVSQGRQLLLVYRVLRSQKRRSSETVKQV